MVSFDIKIEGYYCGKRNIVTNALIFTGKNDEIITLDFPKFVFKCKDHGEMKFGFKQLICKKCGKKVKLNLDITN